MLFRILQRQTLLKGLACLLSLLILAVSSPASAYDSWEVLAVSEQQGQVSREQAVSIAKRAFNGRVLKVKKRATESGPVFVVKILSQAGTVRLIRVHGVTGEVL